MSDTGHIASRRPPDDSDSVRSPRIPDAVQFGDGSSLGTALRQAPAIDVRGLSWPLLVFSVAFLGALWHPALLYDADTYWHIAAGRWILEHGAVPTTDPFSHTMAGAPWMAHEWLAEIVLATAYGLGGWAAVIVLPAFGLAAALTILARYLLRHQEPVHALIFTGMAASLTMSHLLARPHVLALPIMVAWCVALLRAREEDRAPPYWLAALMVLWANLHGSFPIGLGLAGALTCEALATADGSAGRWRAARRWGAFLVAAGAASLLTPFGIESWAFAAQVHDMDFTLQILSEWRSPDFHRLQPLELWLLLAGGVALTRGMRLPAVRLVLVLVLLHLALKHARHAELLGLLAPCIVAQPLAGQWRKGGSTQGLDNLFAALTCRARPAAVAITAGAVVALAGLTTGMRAVAPSPSITPSAALEAASRASLSGPVLNDYGFGGHLIFSGMKPFIDGRADLYGDDFLEAYYRATTLTGREVLQEVLERHAIQWSLLPPDTPAVAVLDRLPGWRRLYADEIAVVHARDR